jgi:hypothetical protein
MWKLPKKDREVGWWDDNTNMWVQPCSNHAPPRVYPAPRLRQDLLSLSQLLSSPIPPTRYLRPRTIKVAFYGFADASGSGFGSSFIGRDAKLFFCHGLWGRDADHVSSNYKELRNLLETIEDGLASMELLHTDFFIFTDNSTAEGAYYKGNTDSKLLFDLVLRLRQIDLSGLIRLHISRTWLALG